MLRCVFRVFCASRGFRILPNVHHSLQPNFCSILSFNIFSLSCIAIFSFLCIDFYFFIRHLIGRPFYSFNRAQVLRWPMACGFVAFNFFVFIMLFSQKMRYSLTISFSSSMFSDVSMKMFQSVQARHLFIVWIAFSSRTCCYFHHYDFTLVSQLGIISIILWSDLPSDANARDSSCIRYHIGVELIKGVVSLGWACYMSVDCQGMVQ